MKEKIEKILSDLGVNHTTMLYVWTDRYVFTVAINKKDRLALADILVKEGYIVECCPFEGGESQFRVEKP